MDHEGAVFAGGPRGLSAGVEALSFLVGLEVKLIPLVREKANLFLRGVAGPRLQWCSGAQRH